MKTVELERLKMIILHEFDAGLLDAMAGPRDVAISTMASCIGNTAVVRIKQEVLGRELEQVEHTYPADWWQACKERWFPAWVLRRWPVRWARVRLTAKELYPKISIPDAEWNISLSKWVGPANDD